MVLRITNDGPGIEPADQERIFERFVRIGASDGAGLGLPIARWIAEAHGGTLQLEEQPARLHDVRGDASVGSRRRFTSAGGDRQSSALPFPHVVSN